MGHALHTAPTLGWSPREGWWCWDVPRAPTALRAGAPSPSARSITGCGTAFAAIPCASLRRRPVTFGGLGDRADGPACRAALCAASTELEKSLLRGLMAGALWTAARVSGHGMQTNSACPPCGAAHEDEVHILWDCPEWE